MRIVLMGNGRTMTMKKLIELDAALSAIGEVPTYNDGMVFEALSHAQRDVELLPTVDAAPVRHGHWKEDPSGYGFWICSHCGFVSEASGADILYRYCPHCGARMNGKDGEEHG